MRTKENNCNYCIIIFFNSFFFFRLKAWKVSSPGTGSCLSSCVGSCRAEQDSFLQTLHHCQLHDFAKGLCVAAHAHYIISMCYTAPLAAIHSTTVTYLTSVHNHLPSSLQERYIIITQCGISGSMQNDKLVFYLYINSYSYCKQRNTAH